MLSAKQDFASFEEAHRFGAAEFVTKPFLLEELRETLRDATDRRRQRNAGRLKLGALLVASGLIDQLAARIGAAPQKADGRRLGEVLVATASSPKTTCARPGGPAPSRDRRSHQVTPSPAAVGLLPRDFIIRHRLLPLRIDDDGTLVIAMTDPLDVVDHRRDPPAHQEALVPAICGESAFDEAVTLHLHGARQAQGDSTTTRARPADDAGLAQDASIIEIVDELICRRREHEGLRHPPRAARETLHVRCRIDGVLHDLREYPAQLQPGSSAA